MKYPNGKTEWAFSISAIRRNHDFTGTFTNEDDFVGEGLGGNKGLDGQASIIDRFNLYNFFKLLTSSSPHSNYECKPPAVCGDRP